MEDIQILKPTLLCAVPRILNRLSDGVQQKLKSASIVARGIFWGCWYGKSWCIKHGLPTTFFDRLVFNEVRNKLGGRLEQLVCAGAALDAATHEFMQIILGIPLRNGYGLTEMGSGIVMGPDNILRTNPGAIGGPLINVEMRMEPIPDYPDQTCGEVLIGGEAASSGYLNDPAQTNLLFVDESRRWIRTGDVGKWTDDGYLKIIDRIRSIFKLSQGEYVAAELIAVAYEDCQFIHQIFVYGDSGKTCLVGIVIPRRTAVASFLGKGDVSEMSEADYVAACKNPAMVAKCQEEMNETAKARNLFGFQWVKRIYMDSSEWTLENDLLTPTLKLRRKALADKYRAQIDQMYKDFDEANRESK
jgi:long-chain acyl-CoA synthetase